MPHNPNKPKLNVDVTTGELKPGKHVSSNLITSNYDNVHTATQKLSTNDNKPRTGGIELIHVEHVCTNDISSLYITQFC